jgi:hypothetical protein
LLTATSLFAIIFVALAPGFSMLLRSAAARSTAIALIAAFVSTALVARCHVVLLLNVIKAWYDTAAMPGTGDLRQTLFTAQLLKNCMRLLHVVSGPKLS